MTEMADFVFQPSEIAENFAENNTGICAKWRQTAIRTNQADPFCCTPCWQLSFHYAFSPKRRLYFKEVERSVVAFAEKVFSPADVVLTPLEPLWNFGTPLLGEHAVAMLGEMLPSIERHYENRTPRILLSGVRPKGRVAARILARFQTRFDIFVHDCGIQCAASLTGGFDGFLSRRSGSFRKNMRKEQARAAEAGIRFERRAPTSREECEQVFARMHAVELVSWKGLGQCGIDQEPATTFYRLLLLGLAETSDARVILARHEGRDIGYVFGGLVGKVYRGQQFSYDDKWKHHGVGNLLQYEQIRWLCEEGARRYDMGPLLGRRMEYKRRWTEKAFGISAWMLKPR